MPTDHERFRRLTVEHALGGLDDAEAEPLRRHLRRCRDCRRRLHELRDLSERLAATERDEQARRIREAADAQGPPRHPEAPASRTPWLAAMALLLATLVGLGFYAFHLRTGQEVLQSTAARQEEALELLATGVSHPVRAEEVTGAAAGDGQRLAVVLADMPTDAGERRLVAWADEGDGLTALQTFAVGREGELVAFTVEAGGAERVVLSLEASAVDAPTEPLAEVDLQAAGQRSSGSSSK